MEPRIETAIEKFKSGYNCCQAIICTYCDLVDMTEEQAFKVSEGFGGGMASMGLTCGAVTGMYMVLSLANSKGDLKNPRETKMETYKLIQEATQKFENKNSSITCSELKGQMTGKPLRSCVGCVEDAAAILDEYFKTK